MRRRRWKRSQAISLIMVGGIGYLLGSWHTATSHGSDLSPAQTVALRFPDIATEAAEGAAGLLPTDAPASTNEMVLGDVQFALFSPEPMVSAPTVQEAPPAREAEQTDALTLPAASLPPKSTAAVAMPASETRASPSPTARHGNRPGFVLNDGQIASIKARLHLTRDQEHMWPAVEAALRNLAYARARDLHRRARTEVASLDPDSAEVRELRSAAFPLLMSFSEEQRNEVRSVAHVMGLDRLASQF